MSRTWKIHTTILLASLALSAIGRADSSATNPYPDRASPTLSAQGKFIDQRVSDFMIKNHLPGMTMAIVQAPYIPRSAGYGKANTYYDELASTKTMWNIGPITQAFTAVAIFQLAEAHKLDLQAPASKYVRGLPLAWRAITVFQLLQHATGIPDFRKNAGYSETRHYRPTELLALVSNEAIEFQSGTQVRDSATDFVLLGLVIENTSGMSYRDYITHRQIEPLGLRSTKFSADIEAQSLLDRPTRKPGQNQHGLFKTQIPYINSPEPATGYKPSNGNLEEVDIKDTDSLFAFGDIWSSAEDISDWDIALAGSTLIQSAKNRELLYKPTTLANGVVVPAMAGWEFTRHPGFMEIKGSSPGFSSYLSRFTAADELVCVTLLTNKEGVDLTGLARDIADAYMAGLGSGIDSDKIVTQESKFSVDETVSRLKANLGNSGTPVFATFDHSDNATKAGLQLRPTQVVVFGNPKVGTKLMLDDQPIALDLPLRISVWEDARGRVWVGYPNLDRLAHDYELNDPTTVDAMGRGLDALVGHTVNVYEH